VADPADELRKVYGDWFAALPAHDAAFFERTLTDDWIYTDIFGTVRTKQEYLEYLSEIPPDATLVMIELSARPVAGVVIVHGLYEVRAVHAGGRDVSSSTRFTSVWIDRDGHWRCLTHHGTAIAQS
jgi:ketosteroid isomerase-like protein